MRMLQVQTLESLQIFNRPANIRTPTSAPNPTPTRSIRVSSQTLHSGPAGATGLAPGPVADVALRRLAAWRRRGPPGRDATELDHRGLGAMAWKNRPRFPGNTRAPPIISLRPATTCESIGAADSSRGVPNRPFLLETFCKKRLRGPRRSLALPTLPGGRRAHR
jgi:hypothetical protein